MQLPSPAQPRQSQAARPACTAACRLQQPAEIQRPESENEAGREAAGTAGAEAEQTGKKRRTMQSWLSK